MHDLTDEELDQLNGEFYGHSKNASMEIAPFELRKARLSCFITELQDILEGHLVDECLIAKLRDVHEDALDILEDLEHDGE